MVRNELLEQAKPHFFAAMLIGWPAGASGVDVPDMPGHQEIVYDNHDFRVLDRYCVSESGISAGTTTIWYLENPIWFMSYGGFYRKEDIPFLKEALMVNYKKGEFIGGRGPKDYYYSGRICFTPVYFNSIKKNSFEYFKGQEYFMLNGETVGRHDYFGMALI